MPDQPITISDALGILSNSDNPRCDQALTVIRWALHRRGELLAQARKQCDKAQAQVLSAKTEIDKLKRGVASLPVSASAVNRCGTCNGIVPPTKQAGICWWSY